MSGCLYKIEPLLAFGLCRSMIVRWQSIWKLMQISDDDEDEDDEAPDTTQKPKARRGVIIDDDDDD